MIRPSPEADPVPSDVADVVRGVGDAWEGLRGRRLFLTGATGWFGSWLLRGFLAANREFSLGAEATALSRDPEAFLARHPFFGGPEAAALRFHRGDVRDFPFPQGGFSHVIHGAADAGAHGEAQAGDGPARMFDTLVSGTTRVLDFAAEAGVRRLLLVGSGAAYGTQPPGLSHVPEDHPGAPAPHSPSAAYGEGKRVAELLCALRAATQPGLEPVLARCYTFIGPGLPLDGPFAAGNFIRDGLRGEALRVRGDGTALRSYLYASDLAIWLWTLLFCGQPLRPYNVGSEDALDIAALAEKVRRHFNPAPPVVIERQAIPGAAPSLYVPSTRRAREELGLAQRVSLDEGLRRTVAWARLQPVP